MEGRRGAELSGVREFPWYLSRDSFVPDETSVVLAETTGSGVYWPFPWQWQCDLCQETHTGFTTAQEAASDWRARHRCLARRTR